MTWAEWNALQDLHETDTLCLAVGRITRGAVRKALDNHKLCPTSPTADLLIAEALNDMIEASKTRHQKHGVKALLERTE